MTSISALLQAIATAPTESTHAGLLRNGAQELLADPAHIDAVAAQVLALEDEDTAEAAASLLAAVLDEARMAAENDAPEGPAVLAAAEAAFEARDADAPFAPMQRLRLAQVYARAGLAPPPFARVSPETMEMADADQVDAGMPDIADLLDPLLAEMADQPLQVHATLNELFAGLPSEIVAILRSLAIARPGAVEARLGLYWLLESDPDLHLAAATALATRSASGPLPGTCAALLPAIRKWLPDGPARAALDTAIRHQMRHGLTRPGAAARIHRTACSLPDGVGALSLVAAVQSGSRRGVAMAMLKQGHGVKDAFVIPCSSATEQKRLMARVLSEIETFDLQPGSWAQILAFGLGEGLAADQMPAPGILDLLDLVGPDGLPPTAADTPAILAAIGTETALDGLSAARKAALRKASADWTEHFAQIDSWFEDTGPLRDAIGRARTEAGRAAAVWKQIAARRDWWARQFAISAAVLKHADLDDPDLWLSFAATAHALLNGTSPKRLPIFQEIVETTLDAYADRAGAPPRGQTATSAAQNALEAAGITPPFLHGFLTALSVTPLEPEAHEWLAPLLGGIEFPGAGTLDAVMAFVIDQANATDIVAGDPDTTARVIKALDADGFQDWITGFDALVTAIRDCWPIKRLSAEDKRVLRAVQEIAAGKGDADLRPILPVWIARRHALRG